MATAVGSIIVKIGADTSDLVKGVGRAEGSLAKVGRAAVSIGKIIASALVAATAAIGAMALKGVQLGDELAKSAIKIGSTAAELAGLRHAAGLSAVSTEQLDKGLQRLGRTVSDADNGLKSATRTLKQLGLDANELEKLPLSEQFLKVTDAMKGMTTQGDKIRISMELFGKAGADLIPLLDQSSDSIREMMNESKALGLQLDQTQSRVVQEASDSMGRMSGAVKGLSLQLGATFAPAIELAAKSITNLLSWVTRSLPKLSALAERFLGIARAVEDLSDADLSVTLIEQIRALDAVNDRLASYRQNFGDIEKVNNSIIRQQWNEKLKEQEEIQARINKLLAERVSRSRALENPPPPPPGDDGDGGEDAMEQRRKAAERLTESMRTELEKQVDAWHEAQALFNEDLITPETLARVRDSLLQPITLSTELSKTTNQERLQDLLATFATETEIEQAHYAQRLEELQLLYSNELLSLEEFNAKKEAITAEHKQRLIEFERDSQSEISRIAMEAAQARAAFEKMSSDEKAKHLIGGMIKVTEGMAQYSKKAFQLNKTAALAEATISMAQGIAAGVKLGWPMGIPAVAWAVANGTAQISAIKRTTFQGGGGGTTPSAAGGPTVNGNPVPSQAGGGQSKSSTLRVEGIKLTDIFTGRQIRGLLERLQEAQKDGTKLVFA